MTIKQKLAEGQEATPSLSTGTTDTSNPWNDRGTGKQGLDTTGWASAVDTDQKIQLLRSLATNGFCYLWIVLLVDAFQSVPYDDFANFISDYRRNCGAKPDGSFMVSDLILRCINQFGDVGVGLPATAVSTGLIDHMMSSKVRMNYEDNGMIHLKPAETYSFGCSCTDVLCNHGWAARFIITIVSKEGRRVGATINFDEIDFDGGDDEADEGTIRLEDRNKVPTIADHQFMIPPPPLNPGIRRSRTFGSYTTSGPARTPMEPRMDTVPEIDDLVKLTERAKQAIGQQERFSSFRGQETNSAVNRVSRHLEKQIEGLKSEIDRMRVKEDIDPDDSSSNFGRRDAMNGQYMSHGTVVGPRSTNLSMRTQPLMRQENMVANNPVIGYLKTNEMIEREVSAVTQISSINGLNSPFTDERLSFLMHIHTALNTLRIRTDQPEPLYKGLASCVRGKPRTNSERLLKEVLNATFDMEQYDVMSNPFKLPYIEIGMRISGGQMVKTFDLLLREYEISWFECMKGLRIPEFHSRFYEISERDPNTTSKIRTREAKGNKGGKERRGSGSLLSYMRT